MLGVSGWKTEQQTAAVLLSQAPLYLLLLHQPPVMRQYFTFREVQRHLQGNQDDELKRNQLLPADPEALLQLLHR